MTDFDVVIVGAGAGGGVAAAVLAAQGWKVALIEKGRSSYPTLGSPELIGSLYGNDELRTHRYYGFHDPLIEPRVYVPGANMPPQVGEVQGLGVCVGGGTVYYDADSPRVTQADMSLLSTFGPVDGADVVDWPIAYSDLAPYYDFAEALIGVQGLAGADPFAEPRNPYPMPPGFPSDQGALLSAGAQSLGYHPHPIPMAINSIFYRGRPACVNCGWCDYGCPVNAKGSTAVTAVRDALLTGNCTLLSECCVTTVNTDPSGETATGVTYIDGSGATQTLTASHVVLAANAIETARLLLASSSPVHPNGLGNSSGLVGCYLMFHITFSAIAIFDKEVRSYRGRVITQAMADFTVSDGSPDYVRGGYVELGGQLMPIDEGTSYPMIVYPTLMASGQYRRNMAPVGMMGEDMPSITNRVTLDPTVRDVYGRPVARITYALGAHDQAVIDRYTPLLHNIGLAAGAVEVMDVNFIQQYGHPETKHLMGTTRMGTDPTASVTDPWGRLHDLQNVWIADGGVFPTSTAYNPTLTQQALAARTASFMANPENPLGVIS